MKKGFTLTEVLVCLAVIALLTAVLLPVLINAKKQGYKTTCQANLKTVGQAMRMYIDDNDGVWPDSEVWSSWNRANDGYPLPARPQSSPRLAGCPSVSVSATEAADFATRGNIIGYAYNSVFKLWSLAPRVMVDNEPTIGYRPFTDKEIVYSATTVLFCDAAPGTTVAFGPDPAEGTSPYPYSNEKGWERHSGGGNYLFCDNHVQWLKKEQVLPGGSFINNGTQPSFALETRPDKRFP